MNMLLELDETPMRHFILARLVRVDSSSWLCLLSRHIHPSLCNYRPVSNTIDKPEQVILNNVQKRATLMASSNLLRL